MFFSALGTFYIQSILSEGDDTSGAVAISHAGRGDLRGSHHPKATQSPMGDPQEGQRGVCQ